MGKVRLDQETAERMLAGVVARADVPPGFEAVAELLEALRSTTLRPVHARVGGPAVVDSRRAGGQIRKERPMFTTTSFRPRLSVLAVAMALSATTGAAFAAGLPADAAGPAFAALHRLGIGSPAAPAPAPAAHPANHGATVSATATTTTATGSAKGALISGVAHAGKGNAGKGGAGKGGDAGASGSSHGKGATISTLARTTTATGAAKGATISAAASGGKSHAGEHGHGASGHGAPRHGGGKPSGAGHGHGHHPG